MMSDEFSESFAPAIETWLSARGQGSRREAAEALTAAYEKGASSAGIDLGAYLTVRAPATFAAISACLREVARLMPDFAPQTLADIGAGPGTACFAAAAQFASLQQAQMIEADARFVALARELAAALPFKAEAQQQSLLSPFAPSQLVIAAYVLAELPLNQIPQVAAHLWRATQSVLLLVEPGTPQGFARIKAARDVLIKAGAQIIGPCTHEVACPMSGDDWCHFKVRLQRSRAHMHAKGAVVPFEDESYAWLAAGRTGVARDEARILNPPKVSKIGVALHLCSKAGLRDEVIASRDKPAYKQAKKLIWGDGFTPRKAE